VARLLVESAAALEEVARDEDDSAPPELLSALALFIAELPSPYREALTLTELEGVPQKDAAVMLGISVSGMKSRVQRGRMKLKAALDACCHFVVDARGKVVDCERLPNARLPKGCCE
jgi:RNA polymerase sigma-70 factor (ECF subfamily)